MRRSIESVLRFVNLSCAGLLAGSLGFGRSALTPGWEDELSRDQQRTSSPPSKYYNAIGPLALATSVGLALGARSGSRSRRTLDIVSAIGLAGVVATTTLGTVPIAKQLEVSAPADYPREEPISLTKRWSRTHSTRTVLGISAFICAAASAAMRPRTTR